MIILSDGSCKPIIETDDSADRQDKTLGNKQDESDQCEPTRYSTSSANVVDLTTEGTYENNAMDCNEPEDIKPLKDAVDAVDANVPLEFNITGIQNEDDFWSGIFFSNSSAPYESGTPNTRLDPHVTGPISEPSLTNYMLTPVITDAVTPALNRDYGNVPGNSQPSNALIRNQLSISDNLLLQPSGSSQGGDLIINSEIGRPAIPRNVSRTPIAVQALPAQPLVSNSQQRPRTSLNTYMANTAEIGVETESQQQQFSRSNMNASPTSDMSLSFTHYQLPMTQV